MSNGRLLAQRGAGWNWTLDAIRYPWRGHDYLLPPLYPVFLSLFALSSDSYPLSAAVAQVVLNAVSVVPLFMMVAALHSRRAALIAALVYALWIPNIWTYSQFMQEQLYLPLLLLAFAFLLHSTSTNSALWVFTCTGMAFGLAALTRSMPLYYLIPAVIMYVAVTRGDPNTPRRAAALLAGFLMVTMSYSVWLSWQVGHFVFIENHGGISVHEYRTGSNYYAVRGIPSTSVTVKVLTEAFWHDPAAFVDRWLGNAGALFHVHSDRWLHYYTAATAGGATAAKVIAHLGIDLPFILCVVLAPVGAVLARRSRESALLVLWVVIVVVASALSSAGGVRYRAPLEPHLIALASVVVARGWRQPRRHALTAALVTAVAASILVGVQVPRLARARANYGLGEWTAAAPLDRTSAHGAFGLHVLSSGGFIELQVRALDSVSVDRPTRLSVRIDDRHVAHHLLTTEEPLDLRYPARSMGLAYVEMNATDVEGNPARVELALRDFR